MGEVESKAGLERADMLAPVPMPGWGNPGWVRRSPLDRSGGVPCRELQNVVIESTADCEGSTNVSVCGELSMEVDSGFLVVRGFCFAPYEFDDDAMTVVEFP